MTDFRDNVRGIVAMVLCSLAFILNDTTVKYLSAEMPLGEIMFVRGAIGTVLLGGVIWALGAFGTSRLMLSRPVIIRTLAEVAASGLYLTALSHMPIANSSSILQAVPLVITAASALFLGEKVGWRRWAAVVVGFLGVLLIVRPGASGFNAYALFALTAVFFITLRDLAVRWIAPEMPPILVAFATTIGVGLFGGVLIPIQGTVPIGAAEIGLIVFAACCLLCGYFLVVVAMQHGEVSVVTPFRYVFIPFSIVTGFVVWREVPDAITVLGIGIIIATGVYTFVRERRLALARARTAAPPAHPIAPAPAEPRA